MRGALYAATEIVVFLVIATLLGVIIGRLWASATRRPATPAATEPPPPPVDDEARAELAKVRDQLAAAEAEKAEIAKQLSIVEWQVTTLEEELAKEPAEDG